MSNSDPRTLKDRVVVVTGASRGIGREIAVRAAADEARVALFAKTETPKPKIPGTLNETADGVREAGGSALPLVCDVRDGDSVERATAAVAEVRAQARSPRIMADAVHALVTRPAAECSGHFYTDEEVLRQEGVDDLSRYRLAARDDDLTPTFYLSPPLPKV